MFGFFRNRRRRKILAESFPEDWLDILDKNVPYYKLLESEKQKELQGHVKIFVHEKNFEGCGGLEMTDDIRVSIAAQACILLLGRKTNYYPGLRSILVYPHSYVVESSRMNADGTVTIDLEHRLGESWFRGEIVLSWDDVQRGASDIRDGHNVVFHEFAHQLDGANNAVDGVPILPDRSLYAPWARVLTKEYIHLIDDLEHHRKTLINSYGATNSAEFFAVVTETYFEKPGQLKKKHPKLYEMFDAFYKQNPAQLYE